MRKSVPGVCAAVVGIALFLLPPRALADFRQVSRCQKRIARAGARFASRVINGTLKCTNAVSECQIQCEQGVFGPPCDTNPPPCCDPDDPGSNQTYADCLADADDLCTRQAEKIDRWEINKQDSITSVCQELSQDELCGAQQPGLNFALLNAGCLALDPNYVCNLTNLVNCVGGPLERQLLDQINALLSPRAGEAMATLSLTSRFPDMPVTRKVKDQLAAGKVDVWSLDGSAGDQVLVMLRNKNDNGDGTSNLKAVLTLLQADGQTPVSETPVRLAPCPYPNACGSQCPQLKRTLPTSGTFYLAVQAEAGASCTGGGYRLIVSSPGGTLPVLVADDVVPSVP